ncbi:MAG TPA: hypothetical protein VHA33_13085, partial [Candidatus Angelobacter sp.]|nr:hypothetical protein [Candidatus Angelobacter sp.]
TASSWSNEEKSKNKTFSAKVEAQPKTLRFNPARLWGVENGVKGRDEPRQERAALDTIFNAIPPSVFF